MSKKREPKLDIEVWADWNELGKPTLMGRLSSLLSRETKFFHFNMIMLGLTPSTQFN